MAKTMAVISDGIVTNMIWCNDAMQETETRKDPGDRPVGIGDTYSDGRWYRDGVEVLTPLEDAEAAMAVFGFSNKAEAEAMKPAVSMAVQRLPDAEALTVKPLYPVWEDLVKLGTVKTDEVGYKFTYNGDLYKCRDANPQFQATWIPGIDTAALYTRIDETHAGTIDDPIPYDGNMELEKGKYYSQDGVVYECIESTGIPVYDPLSSMPRYVKEVTV